MATPLERAKEENRPFLLSLPNVIGVGIGPKLRSGRPTDEMCIKVFVSRKVEAADLSDEEMIPPRLGGFATDVEVMAPLRARREEGADDEGAVRGEGGQEGPHQVRPR